jgi:hypothetical protein
MSKLNGNIESYSSTIPVNSTMQDLTDDDQNGEILINNDLDFVNDDTIAGGSSLNSSNQTTSGSSSSSSTSSSSSDNDVESLAKYENRIILKSFHQKYAMSDQLMNLNLNKQRQKEQKQKSKTEPLNKTQDFDKISKELNEIHNKLMVNSSFKILNF